MDHIHYCDLNATCVIARSVLDTLSDTNPCVTAHDSPLLESMQIDDDHNDAIFADDKMSSTKDAIDSVKKYLHRLKLSNSKKPLEKEIFAVLPDCYEYGGVLGINELLLQIVSSMEGVALATQAMSLFWLCFTYMLNKLSSNKYHLVAVLIMYLKIQVKSLRWTKPSTS